MLYIALTGGIGSGKSTVAKYFSELGIDIIDADEIAHELIQPDEEVYHKIIDYFGGQILDKDNKIDRTYLRQIIFSNKKAKNWLEKLLHPLIYKEMKKRAEQAKPPYCILVIPLLIETSRPEFIDRVLVIDVEEKQQIERAAIRDKNLAEEIKRIMFAQIDRKTRLQNADDVINNNGSLADLKKQVRELHQKYLKLCGSNWK